MDHARHRVARRYAAFLLVAVSMGCTAPRSRTIPEADAQAIRETVIALENSMNRSVDALDCAAGLASAGAREPIFVSNGYVVRTRDALLEMCETMVSKRTGAVFAMDHLAAHVLSPNAAYVVREGEYTINRQDGTSNRVYMVMTTLWSREGDGWKMVHLHESAYPL